MSRISVSDWEIDENKIRNVVVDMARRENIVISVPSQVKIRRQGELIALQTSRRGCLQFLLKISIDNSKGARASAKRTSGIQKESWL